MKAPNSLQMVLTEMGQGLGKMTDSAVLDQLDGICFVTDSDGIIQSVGPSHWDDFAFANEAGAITASAVVGKSLFDFICGDEIKDQLTRLMQRLADATFDSWVMPYRYDSPGIKRNMRLSVGPLRQSGQLTGFVFQSVLLSRTDRPPIDIFDFKARAKDAEQMSNLPTVTICSYCQLVKDCRYTRDKWMEAENYYAMGGASEVRISHGICEPCLETASRSAFHHTAFGD